MSVSLKKKRLIVSVASIAVVALLLSSPLGPLPPLSGLLSPTSGIWHVNLPQNVTGVQYLNITQNGSTASVVIYTESDGFLGIASNHNWSLYYEQGYLEAKYRLEQLQFLKKTALGELSSLVGKSTLPIDNFFRQIQDLQVAWNEYKNLSRTSYTYMVLSEFVHGVNAYIASLSSADMPLLFKLLGYTPGPWNITDVLAVQQLFLWENSAGGMTPLTFNYALQKMPANVVRAFYPAYPAGIQHPIVPYSLNPSVYNETGDISNLSLYSPTYNYSLPGLSASVDSLLANSSVVNSGSSTLGTLLGYSGLNIKYAPFRDFGSNNWAVNGFKTGNSSALLANDPHLTTSVPSIWIGFQLVSPGQNVVGVTFPGFPGIILGHNTNIAWGATNGQVQQTYFYAESVNSSRPGQYFMNGSWHSFSTINETVNVAGGSPEHLIVQRAANGVVLQTSPETIAMDWTGLSPTNEITFFLHINRAKSVIQFRQNATEYFKTAIQNWAVADSQDNIGIFPFGNYPVIHAGNPRGILPGTGQYNWAGFIPENQLPFLYDPSNGFVFSSNQITVSGNYPYYIGWDYESGFRADESFTVLNSTPTINFAAMKNLQLNVHDFSTNVFLGPLLNALRDNSLTGTGVYNDLSSWNGNFTVNSTAASFYNFWLGNYLNTVFMPYMLKYNITQSEGLGSNSFFLGPDSTYHGPLIEDLMNWTMNAPNISWFNNPVTNHTGNASTTMIRAFDQTWTYMNSTYGTYSSSWNWGNIHKRVLSSFFGIGSMNTTQLPSAGDSNTLDASYGLVSDFGPSWRMVVNMSDPLGGVGIYPGGLSENPLSHYYDNTFQAWNNGEYYLLIPYDSGTIPAQFLYMYHGGVSP